MPFHVEFSSSSSSSSLIWFPFRGFASIGIGRVKRMVPEASVSQIGWVWSAHAWNRTCVHARVSGVMW